MKRFGHKLNYVMNTFVKCTLGQFISKKYEVFILKVNQLLKLDNII